MKIYVKNYRSVIINLWQKIIWDGLYLYLYCFGSYGFLPADHKDTKVKLDLSSNRLLR